MTNSIKTMKQLLFLGGILLTTGLTATGQTYEVYLCGDGTATFTADFGGYEPKVGDEIYWVKVEEGGTTTTLPPIVATGAVGQNFDLTVGTGLTAGEHTYHVYVVTASPDECSSDPSDNLSIYKLPETTLTVTAAIEAYCAAASGPDGSATSSEITATPDTGSETLPAGVSYSYTWSATQDGTNVADLSTIGTEGGATFTLNTEVAGTYVLTATASYTVSSGTIKSGTSDDGCPVTNSDTVTVTEQPTKPTIGVS